MEFERFLAVRRALEREQVEYVLVGATALSLHGIIRATEDIDLFVRPAGDNVERLRRALRSVWHDRDIDQIRLEDLAGEFPTIRYGPPDEDFVIDLLSRLGSAFGFDDLESEVVTVEGIRVRVATPATLYRMQRSPCGPSIGRMPPLSGNSSGYGTGRMPVERFRDLDEARRALWVGSDDPGLARRIRRLWTIASRLVPLGIPRGVRRFRRIEDANRERDDWTERRVRAIRSARMSDGWADLTSAADERLAALRRRSFEQLRVLPESTTEPYPVPGKRVDISTWRDALPSGELRIVVQLYQHGPLGMVACSRPGSQ